MKQYLENTEIDANVTDPFGIRSPVADKRLSLAEHAYAALRLAIRATPIASVTVTAAGSPSGIAPTASATAAVTISARGSPRSAGQA